jgi:hypothetical protein
MKTKNIGLYAIAGIASILAIVMVMNKRVSAASDVSAAEILQCNNFEALDAWYEYISELYIIGKISEDRYAELYQVYITRYNELMGVM